MCPLMLKKANGGRLKYPWRYDVARFYRLAKLDRPAAPDRSLLAALTEPLRVSAVRVTILARA